MTLTIFSETNRFGANKQEGTLVLGSKVSFSWRISMDLNWRCVLVTVLYNDFLVPNNLTEDEEFLANDLVPLLLNALRKYKKNNFLLEGFKMFRLTYESNRYWWSYRRIGHSVNRKIFEHCSNGQFYIHDTRINRCIARKYFLLIRLKYSIDQGSRLNSNIFKPG